MATSRAFQRRPRSGDLRRRIGKVAAVAGASALALAACNAGSGSGGGGVLGFDDAEGGVIQIEALGTFEEPGEGAFEAAGRGSGFIVDPSGLAVTNNHVVVGAGTLKVWLNGEELSARILGSSECLDLAVIDLEGDGYPFLDWYEGDIRGAQDVWSLGFPLGDPTFTITRGIVSKNDTPTDTQWASLDHTIEHDARIRGGNSGGPLINEDGRIVGVNYAGDAENDINLAIHRDEVLKVLEQLEAGEDVLSLGINGRGWVSEDRSASGIFVSSIASGSSADVAGIKPGDLITKMEGVTLATDGTMADYCAVLKTHGADDTLTVEVFRPSDGGVYTGQVNGKPLEVASLPTATEQPPGTGGGGGSGAATGDLVTVTDDTQRVSVQVPASWDDVNGTELTDAKGNAVFDVTVSPSISDFGSGWAVSGVAVSASAEAVGNTTLDEILDFWASQPQAAGCTLESGSRQPYSDALYTGSYDWWTGCGGVGSDYVVIAAAADDGSHLIWVRLQMAQGDGWVLEPIVGSFQAAF